MRESGIKRALMTLCATVICMAVGSSAAMADTTHVFEKYIDLPAGVEDAQPVAVDGQGNLLVWINSTNDLGKFDTSGNPVNFSGLGTNILDGAGSFDCPKTPADCDQVAITPNGFQAGTNAGRIRNIVGVDHSGGPADGYIYILNNYYDLNGREQAEIDVFDASGKYRGKIDESQAFPSQYYLHDWWKESLSVASDGLVYVILGDGNLSHVDRYLPVDGNPAHTQFAGQARSACANAACAASSSYFDGGAAGANYYYARGGDVTHGAFSHYMRYPMPEFRRAGLLNFAVSEDFSPDPGPFGTGGYYPPYNSFLEVIGVDPGTEHVYVGDSGAGFQEWDENMDQVGPTFASEGHMGSVNSITFDSSGGPADGTIYVRGPATNQIAVFSPPVIIPDIGDPSADVGHTSAQLSVNIGLAGGPQVSSCRFEWGFDAPSFNAPYQFTTPCDQPTPFTNDTVATVEFTGLTPETNYNYRVVAGNSNGENKTENLVFHTVAVLGVQTDPATNLDRTSGDLNGSLNPDGMQTKYFFEYGTSERYNNRTPERMLAPSGGQQPVPPEHIDGLQAGRTYHFRLVAKNELGKTKGPDRTFLVPANPTIAGVQATGVGEGFADLNARINPLGFDTTYYFEYGSTPSYGEKTPEVALGAQLDPQLVTAPIAGFTPGVIHFRVIAENQWGKTVSPDSTFSFFPPDCPNSHVRQQTNANYLPDCRAYELVSPGRAGNVTLYPGDIVQDTTGGFTFPAYLKMTGPNAGGAATAPPRFGYFGALGAVPGLEVPNGWKDRYVATRTTSGWVTTYPGRHGDEYLLAARPQCNLAMDVCIDYQVPPPLVGGGERLDAPFVWDARGRSLGRWPTNLDLVPNGDHSIADDELSGDFSHYVFSSVKAPFAPGGNEAPPGTVYDNDIGEKTVSIASVLPNGKQIPQEDAPGADPNRKTEIVAVSTDGSHILMAATTNAFCEVPEFGSGNCPPKLASPAHLYMRVNGALTLEVSPGATAVYQGMSSNGAFVFFTSEGQLAPGDTDASVDLYRWSEASDSLELLSQGNGQGNVDDCTAEWTSACDVKPVTTRRPDLDDTIAQQSGDIYFYSPEQLDPNNPGVRNERNLYVFRNGAVHYVSTMDPGTQVDRMQVSPDGSHMAFLSATRATAYVNTAPNDQGKPTQWREMYVFNPSNGEVQCASCIPSGAPPTVLKLDTGFGAAVHNSDVEASVSGRFMSDDGRVAFSTADALAPLDTNQKIDVYEFVENGPKLITSGTHERDRQGGALFYPTLNTGFEGISRDGLDLYFSTFETLVPEDHNGSFLKFYDARTGGGFPIQTELLPCAAADECHGDTSATPAQIGMGTLGDLGSGGNHPQKKAHKKKKKKRHGPKKPKRGKHRKAAR